MKNSHHPKIYFQLLFIVFLLTTMKAGAIEYKFNFGAADKKRVLENKAFHRLWSYISFRI